MSLLELKVAHTAPETALIRRIALVPTAGTLPGFTAGAYVTVHVPGIGRRRYSLVDTGSRPDATVAPNRYLLGVRREETGGGGSLWMHALQDGDAVSVEPPENDFALDPGSGPVLLVAGGIGVTPLISKAAAAAARGRRVRFVYAARRRAEFAFLPDLRALCGDALTLHVDDEAGGVLDIPALFAGVAADESVHVCGPKAMLSTAIAEAERRGWPAGRLCFERFFSLDAAPGTPDVPATAADETAAGDGAFEVVIASTGRVVAVAPGTTIVDALLEAGLDPLYDCMRGECGVCQVGVVAGVPDHRDTILSDGERAGGKVMQICVSRAKTPRLTLDL